MIEALLDVIKHTNGLGFIEIVKITGDETSTLVETMDNNRDVVIKAKLLKPEPMLVGVFGMGHLSLLQGLLTYPNYRTPEAKVSITRRDRKEGSVPDEIVFRDAEGQTSSYRLTSSELIPNQANFKGTAWDVTFSPSKSKIAEFSHISGLYGTFETLFHARTVDGELRFYIGEENSSSHRTFITVAKDIEGSLKGELYWQIQQVLSILKLVGDEQVQMRFTNKGALEISMTTAYAEYSYILPARKR